ncbi:MAG TPA: multicopper oxidase domain-containing protein [Anaerolineales bacterium]|nr:multicopper oxidase domain-containing protein [Anaerolineales bacterium]
MTQQSISSRLGRRDFLKFAGGAVALAAGASVAPSLFKRVLGPVNLAGAAPGDPFDLHFAGTDGWIHLPDSPGVPPFHPDDLAPAPFNAYIFGFRNVTGLTTEQVTAQKMKAQHSAPLFWTRQEVPFYLRVTNLGLQMRPDLIDAHTLHWHGFRNAIPFFDGEPHGSVSIPIGRDFTYMYNSHEPGTYMYHCHVEDVEHVQMGMTGLVFVRPAQDGNTSLYHSGKYAYNDGDGSTGFDREFAMFLSEVWAEAHWADSHIQLPEWSDYHPDFSLLNGRVYPDTLAPNASIDPFNPVMDANGDMIAIPGYEHLKYQPYSSLVECNAGERVLLRFAQLGFKQAAMTISGMKLHVVGKDATLLRSRDGTDTSFLTDTIALGAGESVDAIFTAPAYQGPGPYDTYLLYNRSYHRSSNLNGGYGGQATEVRVYPSGTIAPQILPNS